MVNDRNDKCKPRKLSPGLDASTQNLDATSTLPRRNLDATSTTTSTTTSTQPRRNLHPSMHFLPVTMRVRIKGLDPRPLDGH